MKLSLKNKVLIVGFLILIIVIYKFTIAKTIETKKVVSKLKSEQETLNNISTTIYQLQTEEKTLDTILNNYNLSIDNSFQQSLLKSITSFANKYHLQILAFNKPHELKTTITKLKTYSFEVRGDFISILKMINELEQLQLGKLISIDFEKKTNVTTRAKFLSCKILLQKMGG
ncbi:MAG: hypothetical protein HWD85_00040 [Flavobacteriaceae bacterium]|nr:hypothetical protein [Flavobacteriaceae bacterium]